MAEGDTQRLGDLPPSAKLVFMVLEHEGPLTQKRLVEKTRLSARTTRYALDRLEHIDVVNKKMGFRDARQNLYTLV